MSRRSDIAEIYIATFGRAPDTQGLDYWEGSPLTITNIAESFFHQVETKIMYPDSLSDTVFINTIYNNLFSRDAESAGLNYWVDELESESISRADMILAITKGALGTDAEILSNKTEVGLYFADNGETLTYAESVAVMMGVDETQASVDSAKLQVDEWVEGSPDAPPAPTIDTVAGDNIIDAAEATAGVKITGTGEAGDTVTVTFDNGITLAGGNTATVAADGKWSLDVIEADVTAMGEGPAGIAATQANTDGLNSTPAFRAIAVDTVPPPQPPVDDSFKFTVGPTIVSDTEIAVAVSEGAGISTSGFTSDQENLVQANETVKLTVEAQPTVAIQGSVIAKIPATNEEITSENIWLGTDNAETINGSFTDDIIFGFKGKDTINGGEGNDQIHGGAGKDKLFGGRGDDRLIIDNDDTIVDGGADNDTAEFSTAINMAGKTWTGIEVATATQDGSNLRLTATQYNDLKTFNGDGSNNAEVLSINATNIVRDIDVSGIEFKNGSVANLVGNGVANKLVGSNGNDTLDGKGGTDSIYGGAGDDTIIMNNVDSVVDGGEGNDTVRFGVTIDMTGNTWTSIETVTATANNISLTLTADQAKDLNVFNGDGNAANNEVLTINATSAAKDIDASGISLNSGSRLVLNGTTDANKLTGGNGNDTINGGDGTDTLTGGRGSDTLTGGNNRDTFVITAGDSTPLTVDNIMDFISTTDKISFGGPAGTALNYTEAGGGGASSLAVFLTDANAALGGAVKYYAQFNTTAAGDGYLAYDSNGDGVVDEVVQLTGVGLASDIDFADII